jgi:hypothetical protein
MIRVLILSDLHVGSPVGLCLPEVTDNDYQMTYVSNSVQNFLWDKWNVMRQKIGHVDILMLNGDLVEGENRKENGTGVISTNISAQAFISATLVKMIDADEIYVTNGSKYHTGQTSGDQIVCQMVDGTWLGDHQFIQLEDLVLHLRHKISYSSVPYSRCTGQRKEAMIMKSQGTNVDIYIRSHTHRFNFSGDSNDITINTPCWKGLDHFMNQGSQEMPDNGYVLLEIDGPNYKWDYSIFTIPHALYKTCMVA